MSLLGDVVDSRVGVAELNAILGSRCVGDGAKTFTRQRGEL